MSVRPSAANLRERVYVELRRRGDDDGYGNYIYEWEKLRESPFNAQITPIRGLEQTISGANQGVSYWNIIVRYSDITKDITSDYRIVDARKEDRVFNVIFPADFTEKNRHVRLLCTLGRAEG